MGMSAGMTALLAGLGGAAVASAMTPKSSAPAIAAPPQTQASQAPDAMGQRAALAGSGQGGGSPGIAQTFLSGTQGVDPSLLQLGKNTLLGGGSPSPTGMASMG